MVGSPIQPLSADIIRTYGGTPEDFAARQLTPKILREADLVLTMASHHRGEVLQLDASLLKRTFTIREFARMVTALEDRGDAPPSGPDYTQLWRELPARASSVRHLVLAEKPSDNDVADPYKQGTDAYLRMEDELAPAILRILRYARLTMQPS
jgi:protein-tyrosine phosphatase